MKTLFSPAQLDDAHMRSSEKILRSCVHCGFCTATCPTYLLEGDELDSPRGRIYLIKDMLEGGKPATPEVVKHIDRCLSCLSCMTTCPSGVHYMHLVDHARAHIESTYQRPWHQRFLRSLLAQILPYRARFRVALAAAFLVRPLRSVFGALPYIGASLRSMLSLAPASFPSKPIPEAAPVLAQSTGKRVVILEGCAQPVLRPSINEAARRLLARHGIEVVRVAGEGCCGALVHHMGREANALNFARANVDVWSAQLDRGLDAILVTTSGCGTTIKDYGFMLREDPAYAQKAQRVSEAARDISEYVATLPPLPNVQETGQVVAYHAACSLQHGQKVTDAPKRLLKAAGFALRDVPEAHICCGSAGVYNILQPDFAQRLGARKVANLEKTRPQIIAAGNIGCMTQIAQGTNLPIVHVIELLDWASGGPKPVELL